MNDIFEFGFWNLPVSYLSFFHLNFRIYKIINNKSKITLI